MTTHVAREGQTQAICQKAQPGEEVVPWLEAMKDPNGRHFDCVYCHQALTGGQRHSRPEGEDQ